MIGTPTQKQFRLCATQYVSFDTAKKLKYAGFPQSTKLTPFYTRDGREWHFGDGPNGFARPSLATAMKWLREEKKIVMNVGYWQNRDDDGLPCEGYWNVDYRTPPGARKVPHLYFEPYEHIGSYEEAADEGIAEACRWLMLELNEKTE